MEHGLTNQAFNVIAIAYRRIGFQRKVACAFMATGANLLKYLMFGDLDFYFRYVENLPFTNEFIWERR